MSQKMNNDANYNVCCRLESQFCKHDFEVTEALDAEIL